MADVPCPFVYASGKKCSGRVIRVEAYKADLEWSYKDGRWVFGFSPRSHYHLFCSERAGHGGIRGEDDPRMKYRYNELPEELRAVLA